MSYNKQYLRHTARLFSRTGFRGAFLRQGRQGTTVIFGANPQVIDFDFIAAKVSMPQSTLMAIWFGAGFLIALLFAAWQLSVLWLRCLSLRRRLRAYEARDKAEDEQKKADEAAIHCATAAKLVKTEPIKKEDASADAADKPAESGEAGAKPADA